MCAIWGLDLTGTLQDGGGVGGLLAVIDATTSTIHQPYYDGNGNVHALVNRSTGAVTAAYEYSAFGETLRATGSFAQGNAIRFSSKYTDDETGLVYYGRRYYSPSQGRFLGRDTGGEKGGLHLYAFVLNNPISAWDVLGMWTQSEIEKMKSKPGPARTVYDGSLLVPAGASLVARANGIWQSQIDSALGGSVTGARLSAILSGNGSLLSAIDNTRNAVLERQLEGQPDIHPKSIGIGNLKVSTDDQGFISIGDHLRITNFDHNALEIFSAINFIAQNSPTFAKVLDTINTTVKNNIVYNITGDAEQTGGGWGKATDIAFGYNRNVVLPDGREITGSYTMLHEIGHAYDAITRATANQEPSSPAEIKFGGGEGVLDPKKEAYATHFANDISTEVKRNSGIDFGYLNYYREDSSDPNRQLISGSLFPRPPGG